MSNSIEEIADVVVYSPDKCWDCPLFDDEAPSCPLYRCHIFAGNIDRPEICRVNKIRIEFRR